MELYTYLVNSIQNLEIEGIEKWVKPFNQLEFSLNIYHNLIYKKAVKIEKDKAVLREAIKYEEKNGKKAQLLIEDLKKEDELDSKLSGNFTQ